MNQTATNDSISSTSTTAPVYVTALKTATAGFGLIAAVENLGIIMIICTSRRLLKSSSLLIGLTFGHALNGLTHAIQYWPKPPTPPGVNRFYCLTQTILDVWIGMYQLLPIILVLIASERLLAVAAPMWYRSHCSHRRLWILTLATFGGSIALMFINIIRVSIAADPPLPIGCYPPHVFGLYYMVVGVHGLGAAGGIVATVFTVIGVLLGRHRLKKLPSSSKGEIARMKKQVRLTKCILMVSCIDIVCVVIPHINLVLLNLDLLSTTFPHATFSILAYTFDSGLNVVAYLLFNKEFRSVCAKLLKCSRGPSVSPTSGVAPTFIQITPPRSDKDRF